MSISVADPPAGGGSLAGLRIPWWLLTAYALIMDVAAAPVLVRAGTRPELLRGVAMAGLALTAVGWLVETRDRRSRWPVVVAEAVTVLLVSTSVGIPDQAKGLLFAVVARRGVCGSSRTVVAVGVGLSSGGFVLAVAASHLVFADARLPATESLAALPGLVISATVMRMLVEGLTARARAERAVAASNAALRRQAMRDELTGLANRRLFLDSTAGRLCAGDSAAVLLLDLDAFKTVNDTLGHAAGDLLLIEVAQRLRTCLCPGDLLARLGGDEFAVLLAEPGEAGIAGTARQILGTLDKPIQLRTADAVTTEVRVRVSLGAAVGTGAPSRRDPGPPAAAGGSGGGDPVAGGDWEGDGAPLDASALLRAADLAMYAAKRGGGHRLRVFEPAMQHQVRERVALENGLREAVGSGALFLHYQPCVDLETRQIASTEALLRWTDPVRGAVPPLRFVPIAEDTGMIVPIGRWALTEACRQAGDWRRVTGQVLPVAVNISVRQLADERIAEDIATAIGLAGLAPECLVLELTESELADHSVLPTLHDLKDLGVRLALDDFGTGYSALAYLRRFPLDILKIDRAFVTPITTDPSAAALTRSIIEMAHVLGLATVAEGVETAEQAAMLRQMRCQLAQGFHFAEPQPPEAIAAGLRRQALYHGPGVGPR